MHRILDISGRVAVVPSPKYHYRQRPDSITNTYSAKNLLDYANAYVERYFYIKNRHLLLFEKERVQVLYLTTIGISRLWRWWYGCDKKQKMEYSSDINELKQFSIRNIPLFGYSSWPCYLRILTVFLKSDNVISFKVLYMLNRLCRSFFFLADF